MNKRTKKKLIKSIVTLIVVIILCITSPEIIEQIKNTSNKEQTVSTIYYDWSNIPEYTEEPYVILNNNKPEFNEEDYNKESFENYSELDILGRCGVAYAKIGKETMPKEGEERGEINSVQPTGWKQKEYDGNYLYNRCHLIGYQLSDENANELNLITGTRYFNVTGMLPFENQVAEYVKENKNGHVLYRVTPYYKEKNLVASGVQMEAYSIEDNGQSVCFNVYVYNVQPGINIDYSTGESSAIVQ